MNTAVTMQSYVKQFLDERRRLGFASRSMGYALASFARYIDGLERKGRSPSRSWPLGAPAKNAAMIRLLGRGD